MSFQLWLLLLKICTSATLFARGWLTWRWDSPVRGIVWKEDWWSSLITKTTGMSWNEFATVSDTWIDLALAVMGWALMLSAILPWIVGKSCCPRTRWLLLPAALLLLMDSFARWVGVDFDFGMAIEHSLQMVAPIALLIALGINVSLHKWSVLVSIAAAFTFIGHGFYAAGIHPVPLSYQNMTMGILGVNQETALIILSIAGWLDIIFAIGIFIPKARTLSLYYLVLWGGATALARTVAHFDLDAAGLALDPWLFETVVRTPHWLLPLLLLFLYRFKITTRQVMEESV